MESKAHGGNRSLARQRSLVLGRIAAKDAVRAHLREQGREPLFPVEVRIEPDAAGRPQVHLPFAHDLRVSLAHCEGFACALVGDGTDVGIDVEAIAPRGEGFAAVAFTHDELALLPHDARDEWMTRLWAAKEAAGKAQGTGLAGDPKSLRATQREGERMLVEGRWVETTRMGERIVAWTR